MRLKRPGATLQAGSRRRGQRMAWGEGLGARPLTNALMEPRVTQQWGCLGSEQP